jgi:hypothetical protein
MHDNVWHIPDSYASWRMLSGWNAHYFSSRPTLFRKTRHWHSASVQRAFSGWRNSFVGDTHGAMLTSIPHIEQLQEKIWDRMNAGDTGNKS